MTHDLIRKRFFDGCEERMGKSLQVAVDPMTPILRHDYSDYSCLKQAKKKSFPFLGVKCC